MYRAEYNLQGRRINKSAQETKEKGPKTFSRTSHAKLTFQMRIRTSSLNFFGNKGHSIVLRYNTRFKLIRYL